MWLIHHTHYNYIIMIENYEMKQLLQILFTFYLLFGLKINTKIMSKKLRRIYAHWNPQAAKFPNFIRLLDNYRPSKKISEKQFKEVNEA